MVQKGWTICACGWWANGRFCPHCGQARGRHGAQQAWSQAPPWQPQKGSGKGQRPGASASPPWSSDSSACSSISVVPSADAAPAERPIDELHDAKAKVSALQTALDALPDDAASAKEEIAKLLATAKVKLQDLMPHHTQLAVAIKAQRATEVRRHKAEEAFNAATAELASAAKASEEARARLIKVKQTVAKCSETDAHGDDAHDVLQQLIAALGPKELIPKHIADALTRLEECIPATSTSTDMPDTDATMDASLSDVLYDDDDEELKDGNMSVDQLAQQARNQRRRATSPPWQQGASSPSTASPTAPPAAPAATPRL